MSSTGWTWDPHRRDHYYCTQDSQGNWIYHWQSSQGAQQASPQSSYSTQAAYSSHPSYQSQSTNPSQADYSTQTTYSQQASYPTQATHASYGYSSHSRNDSGSAVYPYQSFPQNPAYPTHATSHADASGGLQTTLQPTLQPTMPDPLPYHIKSQLPDLIEGTPARGWREPLDQSYCMRTGAEARQFFRIGRVFSMLYSEAASEQLARRDNNDNDAITVVRFNQSVYSQIRRFVIVEVRRGFVYACAISTYSGRGVLKPGCLPSEHTIVYAQGASPTYLQGEYEAGMTKEPIEIIPADSSVTIIPTSRLRLGKIYPVEWNVKVKDIGQVHPEHLSKLIMYYEES